MNQLPNGLNKNIMTKLKLTFVLLLVATITFAQKSPKQQATGTVDEISITVDYSAPSVKGRTVWGDLVPYNKVWRAGANENTTISFDKDATIKGHKVPAGKYGFFIIPSEEGEWVAVFSKKNDAWGSKEYSKDNDQLRIKVETQSLENNTEMMSFTVDSEKGIQFNWEKKQFFIPIK